MGILSAAIIRVDDAVVLLAYETSPGAATTRGSLGFSTGFSDARRSLDSVFAYLSPRCRKTGSLVVTVMSVSPLMLDFVAVARGLRDCDRDCCVAATVVCCFVPPRRCCKSCVDFSSLSSIVYSPRLPRVHERFSFSPVAPACPLRVQARSRLFMCRRWYEGRSGKWVEIVTHFLSIYFSVSASSSIRMYIHNAYMYTRIHVFRSVQNVDGLAFLLSATDSQRPL